MKVQADIWKYSKHKGSLLLIMLAIGDFADDDGMAYPSIRTLATKTKLSERGVQYLLARLERSKELTIERGSGPRGCNLFRVQVLREGCNPTAGVQSLQGCKDHALGVQNHVKRGATAIAPEPSRTIIEPSGDIYATPEPRRPYGEFGNAKLTDEEYGKLKAKLDGNLEDYINRFDRWAQEQPKKAKGRVAYLSILNWFDRDRKEGRNGQRKSGSAERVAEIKATHQRIAERLSGTNPDRHG